jgi:DNA invertase Pin-like site-specific DNA recombinase
MGDASTIFLVEAYHLHPARFIHPCRKDTKGLVLMLDELKNLGVGFVSYQENIDVTGSPFGAAIFTVIAAIAALERDTIVERVKCGLRQAKTKGVRLGRPKAPLDLEKVKQLRARGHSLRDIAKLVNASFGVVSRAVKAL